MKCIQGILDIIKKGKLEKDSRLKYTWIWNMSSIWSNIKMDEYDMHQHVWNMQRDLEVQPKV